MKTVLAFVLVFPSFVAQADTLTDVRAAVRRMQATTPVKGTYTTEQHVQSAGKFANQKTDRLVSAEVAHDANGVSIVFPQALLDKVSRARAGGDTGAQDLIGAIRPMDIVDALDFSDTLLEMLDGAVVLKEVRGTFAGNPALRVSVRLKPRTEKKANTVRIGSVKIEEQLHLWIGGDHLPLEADRVQTTTAGFMFLHGTFTGRTKYTFLHVADRLLVSRLETNDDGSGMGQNVKSVSVQTLTLH